jgi:DNA processing protein
VTKLEWVVLACYCASRPKLLVDLKENGPQDLFDKIKKENKAEALAQAETLLSSSAFSIITQDDPDYPTNLFKLLDPPACLFVKGKLPSGDAVSMVGTRKASPLGLSFARSFGHDLAKAGLITVSGLADGIDQTSQLGTLDADGVTVSVLGEGFDKLAIYKKTLVEKIVVKGAVVSEYPPSFPAANWTFPMRNRIIAALSKATLVIESPESSGSLITARYAMELGNDVLATPGAPGVQSFVGCNKLIKDGAKLVDCVEDVLDIFGIKNNPVNIDLGEVEKAIVDYCDQPRLFDGIADQVGLPTQAVLEYLTILTLKGLIVKAPGGFYVKASFSNAKSGKNRR